MECLEIMPARWMDGLTVFVGMTHFGIYFGGFIWVGGCGMGYLDRYLLLRFEKKVTVVTDGIR